MLDTHPVVIADADGMIRFWSPAAQTHFGHVAATVVGKPLDIIIPPEYHERHWRGFRAAMNTGASKMDQPAANLPVVCSDGHVERFAGRLFFLRDASGKGVGAMAIYTPNADGQEGDPTLPNM